MARLDLFVLAYTRRNATRTVYYESQPRAIGYEDGILDAAEPAFSIGSAAPDSWPYADGQFISAVQEGAILVSIYATRATPFARFVAAAGGNPVCDLQLSQFSPSYITNPANSNAYNLSFAVGTSSPPWKSSLDGSPPEENLGTYLTIPLGPHTLVLTDAQGCTVTHPFTLALPEPDDNDPTDPTTIPPGAILLRIRDKAYQDPAGDYYEHTAYYYLPATRSTGSLRLPNSSGPQAYSRDQTEVIDRWCVDPGVPPYVENQVRHDGIGGITITPVSGVTACQIRCTLGLSVSGETAEGLGTITAVVSGAQGAVQVSVDNWVTAQPAVLNADGVLEAVFNRLPEGRYVVRARDAQGCTASATVELLSAYGPRYQHCYRNANGQRCRTTILARDYTGTVELVKGLGQGSAVISQPGSATDHVFSAPLKGSALDMAWLCTYRGQFLELFSGDERLHRVEHTTAGVLDWRGYLPVEQYDIAFLPPPTPFTLTAVDGLGTLSDKPFLLPSGATPTGDWLLLEVVLLCLNKCALELPLHVLGSLYPVGADRTGSFLESARVDVAGYLDSKGKPLDCGQVLRRILTSFQCRLYQQDGALWLERLFDLRVTELTYFAYSPGGVALPVVRRTLLRSIEKDSPLYWVHAAQRQALRPAVAYITAREAVGDVLNHLRPALPAATATVLPNWTGSLNYSLVYQGRDKTPLLRLPGLQPGQPITAGQWVQTPGTQPLPPFGNNEIGIASNPSATLRFKAKAYGVVAPDPNLPPLQQDAQRAYLGVGVRFGSVWNSSAGGNVGTPTSFLVALPASGEVTYAVPVSGFQADPASPYVVRFTQPTAGVAPEAVTVDVYDIELVWQDTAPVLADTYTDTYEFDTEQQVSRRDEDTTLFHMDTPYARRAGTLLDARTGLPTSRWQESAGGDAYELGDFWVATQASYEAVPAQALTGQLRGSFGPGALLTDPCEARPAVYLLTDYRRDADTQQHQVALVQLLRLRPAGLPPDPDYVLYTEDELPLLTEDGLPLLLELANAR